MQFEGFQADSQVERNAVKMEFHTLYADWGIAAQICLLLLWCPGSNWSANRFKDGCRSQIWADLTLIVGRT